RSGRASARAGVSRSPCPSVYALPTPRGCRRLARGCRRLCGHAPGRASAIRERAPRRVLSAATTAAPRCEGDGRLKKARAAHVTACGAGPELRSYMTVPPAYHEASVMPIHLSDSQLETLMRAASVLNVYDRDDFLRAVAQELSDTRARRSAGAPRDRKPGRLAWLWKSTGSAMHDRRSLHGSGPGPVRRRETPSDSKSCSTRRPVSAAPWSCSDSTATRGEANGPLKSVVNDRHGSGSPRMLAKLVWPDQLSRKAQSCCN